MRRELIPLFLVLLAGCGQRVAPDADGKAAGPVPVKTVRLAPATVRRVVEQPGAVHAYEQTQLYARIPGYVRPLAPEVDIGKRVKAGEVLAELSVPEMEEEERQKQAMVNQASAALVQSRKALEAARAQVAATRAGVDEARAGLKRARALFDRWNSEHVRMTGLVKSGVIDAQARDEVENQFRAAAAGRDEADARVASVVAAVRKSEADRDKADADVAAAAAHLEVARADARRMQELLNYKAIRAPFAGVLTRRQVNTGDFIQPGKANGLFTVARLDPVRVVVEVPEADAALVHKGMKVALTIPARRPPQLDGAITRTSWALEAVARTLRAEIDLRNPDGELRPGMYVHATLTAEVPAAMTLPASAVARQGDETVAYRIIDGKAVRTVLRIGLRDARHVEVLGLRDGVSWSAPTGQERFAADNLKALTDGAVVEAER